MDGSRLSIAKNTFTKIVDNLMQPHDRISVISFDTNAFIKMRPHPVRKVKKELPDLMSRIFAGGATALYDAIVLGYGQIENPDNKTMMFVLTDGEDNSSKSNYNQVMELAKKFPNIQLHIIHIGNDTSVSVGEYAKLCEQTRGEYKVVKEAELETQFYLMVEVKLRLVRIV